MLDFHVAFFIFAALVFVITPKYKYRDKHKYKYKYKYKCQQAAPTRCAGGKVVSEQVGKEISFSPIKLSQNLISYPSTKLGPTPIYHHCQSSLAVRFLRTELENRLRAVQKESQEWMGMAFLTDKTISKFSVSCYFISGTVTAQLNFDFSYWGMRTACYIIPIKTKGATGRVISFIVWLIWEAFFSLKLFIQVHWTSGNLGCTVCPLRWV